jgi:ribosomal protein uS5
MSDDNKGAADSGEGHERGFGGRGGRRGRGRGERRGRGRGRRGGDGEKSVWTPTTKLGRLVKAGLIKKIEDIFLAALPIKEYEIIDQFFGDKLKDEVMKIMPVQKQTTAGQRTRFKAFVVVGDYNGHIGLGQKCSREVAGAIRGALIDAKLSITPVRRGYWGNRFGAPHTVPCKVTGKCGSSRFRVMPAPRGTGIVAAKAPKKVLNYAGYKDLHTNAKGNTKTLGNFVKAAFNAIAQTNRYLTPDLWPVTAHTPSPYQAHTDFLQKNEPVKKAFDGERRGRGGFGGGRGGGRFRGGRDDRRDEASADAGAPGAPAADDGAADTGAAE